MNKNTFENYVKEYCHDLSEKQNRYAHKRSKHAAVLTYDNVIISSGVNMNVFNDFTKTFNPLKCMHAEAVAILRALKHHSKIIHKCDIWVCRNNANNKSSKPCPMCQKILKSFKIKTIHYTDQSGVWQSTNL